MLGETIPVEKEGRMTDPSASFEPHRAYLRGLAYRMLGAVSDADDVVQEAFLRWSQADRGDVDEPKAFLTRIVTRLCIDQLKSARTRREKYVGTWLPEPMVGEGAEELAGDLSVALLLTLERLSALERAAFLLHDVFDADYPELATTLSRSEAACRQLVSRAREHVHAERPRYEPSKAETERLSAMFHAALESGDVTALARCLADDAVLYSDGGGRRLAALNPIYGKDKILRFFAGVAKKRGLPPPGCVMPTTVNGLPGFLLRFPEGVETVALEIHGDRIAALYAVRNPDKLGHLQS
jgi:RNA polymerase sigma-70 factor (ECF subfamily)